MSGLLTEGVRTGAPSRFVFRTPGLLFDIGLGRLVGHRFLQLTHRGRSSGRIYRTVLEVMSYDPSNHESVVLSGWGERADWCRNIRATPALEVSIAGGKYLPVQRFLDSGEFYARLQGYVKRNWLHAGSSAAPSVCVWTVPTKIAPVSIRAVIAASASAQ